MLWPYIAPMEICQIYGGIHSFKSNFQTEHDTPRFRPNVNTLCRYNTCSLRLWDGHRLKMSGNRSSGIFGVFDYVECESFSDSIFQTSEYIRWQNGKNKWQDKSRSEWCRPKLYHRTKGWRRKLRLLTLKPTVCYLQYHFLPHGILKISTKLPENF